MTSHLGIPRQERSRCAFAHYRELVEESNLEPVEVEHGFDLTEAQSSGTC
jgi:hypothetical protein